MSSINSIKFYNKLDYIPVISTFTNLFDLFLKYVVFRGVNPNKNDFVNYLHNKSFTRRFLSMFPVIGNISLLFYELVTWNQRRSSPPTIPIPSSVPIASKPTINHTVTAISALQNRGLQKEKYFFSSSKHNKVQQALNDLRKQGFFQKKSHKLAKKVFKAVMAHFHSQVYYVNAKNWDYSKQWEGVLDPSIFCWSVTNGVQYDIKNAAKDKQRIHLFSVASQYNAAEAANPYTPGIGKAMYASQNDHTQGPFAQRTNPTLFEFVNAFLANLGFNMMEKVLPSAGKTFENNSAIQHGYLRPNPDNIEQLSMEMKKNFQHFEAPCYETRPSPGGQSVFLMLGAAPALGYSYGIDSTSKPCKNLQYWAFIANFTALCKQALFLLQTNEEKEIVLHITGTGLGVFACEEEVFAAAIKQVCLQFQHILTANNLKNRIRVQFDCHEGTSALRGDVPEYERFGYGKRKAVGYLLGLQKR